MEFKTLFETENSVYKIKVKRVHKDGKVKICFVLTKIANLPSTIKTNEEFTGDTIKISPSGCLSLFDKENRIKTTSIINTI